MYLYHCDGSERYLCLTELFQRYPGGFVDVHQSPGERDCLELLLYNVTTPDAVVVASRTDSPSYFEEHDSFEPEVYELFAEGTIDQFYLVPDSDGPPGSWKTVATLEAR